MEHTQKTRDDTASPGNARQTLDRQTSSTPSRLNRLFSLAVSNPLTTNLPLRSAANSPIVDSKPLPQHLYTRGFLDGRHSDIRIIAFGQTYALHRLILDQAVFFASALQEPWLEATAKEIVLHPEEIDQNITRASFELALKRLYGCRQPEEEDEEAIGLFATGCWLEMPDLIEDSVLAILRCMSADNIAVIIQLITTNYYGKHGERILASAKSLVNRDGLTMPAKCWEDMPSEVIRDVVGGDAFFVPHEVDRWVLARSILNRKIKRLALKNDWKDDLTKAERKPLQCAPRSEQHFLKAPAIFTTLYSHSEITPLLQLLDEGIHYMYLDFEDLQRIRSARDTYGTPLVPDKIISDALWQNLQLRQCILSAKLDDPSLHLGRVVEDANILDFTTDDAQHADMFLNDNEVEGGTNNLKAELEEIDASSIGAVEDESEKPRRYWIPPSDNSTVSGYSSAQNSLTRSTTVLCSQQLPADDSRDPSKSFTDPEQRQPRPVSYTHIPPFRFAVELPHPKYMKEKKKIHSSNIWIAGSLWNIYCQKLQGSTGPRLGFYLYRAKVTDTNDTPSSVTVEGRIGALERDIVIRSAMNERLWRKRRDQQRSVTSPEYGLSDTSSHIFSPTSSRHRPSGNPLFSRNEPLITTSTRNRHLDVSDSSDDDQESVVRSPTTLNWSSSPSIRSISVLPPYTDPRPIIKAYFKIFLSSNAGRTTTLYESAPDTFKRSQSWGWESAAMMADEPALFADVDDDDVDSEENDHDLSESWWPSEAGDLADAVHEEGGPMDAAEPGVRRKRKDPKLKFVVVLGVV